MNSFEELATLDRLIHEPARLAILTALSSIRSADFLFLQHLTGLTGGNLSAHLAKLSEAGLVEIDKQFVERSSPGGAIKLRPNTQARITPIGRQAIDAHWQKLEELRRNTRGWKPVE